LASLNKLSLYIHIPFCAQKCSYCDFFSAPYDPELAGPVLEKILDQLFYQIDSLGKPCIETVYIGGGTPNVLPPKLLKEFLQRLRSVIAPGNNPGVQEFSIECNPHLLKKEQFSLFQDVGITRISIGIQSLDDNLRTVLGRVGSSAEVLKAVEMVTSHWSGRWSCDLITGIPEQTERSALEDLETVLEFSPNHISLYSLTLEPDTPLWKRIQSGSITPLSEEREFSIWQSCLGFLRSNGYRRYEISNFEKNGNECRHNIRYWKMLPYLGCGPSAVSTLFLQNKAFRYQNPRDINTYLAAIPSEQEKTKEELSPDELLFEFFMMGFRLAEGIDLERINKFFGIEWKSKLGPLFKKWEQDGFLYWIDDNRAALTEDGWRYNNRLLVELLDKL
jgi:oxygen-independent coproporphyrinogen-3 oxidase